MQRGILFAVCAVAMTSGTASAQAALSANVSIALTSVTGPVGSPTYNYTVTLHNTGTTQIGTLWYAWLDNPELDFLPSLPTNVSAPNGWYGLTPGGPGHYSIEWYNLFGTNIPVGGTQTFTFSSADSPTVLNGQSPAYPAYNTQTSFLYEGFPEATAGLQFVLPSVAVAAPEPASLSVLGFAGGLLLMRRRRSRN